MSDTLARTILDRLAELQLSQSDLCRQAGISRQTLHTLIAEEHKLPSLQTVIAVAGPLKLHPMRLLQAICDDRVALPGTLRVRHKRGDKSAFVRDVSFPDGALVLPGQRFLKTWELLNAGSVPWVGRTLRCMDEEVVVYRRNGQQLHLALPLQPEAMEVPIPTTAPGHTVQISVAFTAPNSPGSVLSYWKAMHPDGSVCYPASRGVWVKVLVSLLASAASATD